MQNLNVLTVLFLPRTRALLMGCVWVVFLVALVRLWTRDHKVAGSTLGRGAIKSTRSTQPSIPPGQVNRVGLPAFMAGVKTGYVHLCQVAGITVWSHMTSEWHSVAVPWNTSINGYTVPLPFTFTLLHIFSRLFWGELWLIDRPFLHVRKSICYIYGIQCTYTS